MQRTTRILLINFQLDIEDLMFPNSYANTMLFRIIGNIFNTARNWFVQKYLNNLND